MRNNFFFLTVPALIILAVGAAGAMYYRHANISESESDMAAADIATLATPVVADVQEVDPAAGDTPVLEPATPSPTAGLDLNTLEQAQVSEPAPAVKASDIKVIVEGTDPKAPRSVGSIDAPVTMIDFSSLTCPHCAHAHETILPQLIKDYVETGKLRIVFNDFPLNQQALDASKVARCVSGDQYFNFLTMLFSTIEQWAYTNNHPKALLQNATLAGLSEEKATQCLNDKDVEQSLMLGVQNAAQKYAVQATPTFVFNDGKKTLSGARPYAEFKAAIDELIAGQ